MHARAWPPRHVCGGMLWPRAWLGVSLALFATSCLVGCQLAPPPFPERSTAATPAVVTENPQLLAAQGPTDPPAPVPAGLAAMAAQSPLFRFDHLPPEAGLSQSVVTDFTQDDQGFLWLATQDGLNRYDGANFKIFKDDPTNPSGLRGNFIAAIDKAPNGELWIGTNDGGLNRYDPRSGRFTAYLHDPDNPNSLSENSVPALDVDEAGIVWVGTNNRGLNRLDPGSGQIVRYVSVADDRGSLSADAVTSVLADDRGSVWVGTLGGGLNRLNLGTGQFTRYQNGPNDTSLSDNSVQTLYLDRQGTLWVGTFTAGLNHLDVATGKFVRYANNTADSTSLAHNSVAAIFEDRAGRLWVGTQGGGLNVLDRASGRFARFRHNPAVPESLSRDGVVSIFEDNAGIVWLGTFGSGADYVDPNKNKFVLVRHKPDDPHSLADDSLWAIVGDKAGDLWIGTNGHGLDHFIAQTGTWRHYRSNLNDPTSLSNDTVYALYIDRQDTLWIGTPTGLVRYDAANDRFDAYAAAPVYAILEDRQGTVWLGSAGGLGRFDRTNGATRFFQNDPQDPTSLSSNLVGSLLEDAQGNFWVSTLNGGLNLFDRAAETFTHFTHDPNDAHSLSSNAILTMVQSRDGTLWLGTTVGLNRFDRQAGTFTAYREADGMPNDYVYGILEDDQSHLWLSTNKGIAHFDPRTGRFRNYDQSDGLQGSEFNQWSYFKDAAGVMYFGGVNGLNAFHPGLIQDNPFIPPIVLTDFEIYNQPVQPGPGSPLQRPIEASQVISLSYTDSFFEIGYAALHFSSPAEARYAYMMEGLDKAWNEVGNRRYATYTNVPPGDYTFRVKGTNSDGVWNEAGTALRIVIPPPFWQTTWFRVLVAAGFLGAISGVFVLRIRAVERQRQHLETQVEDRTHELHAAMLELEHSRDAAEAASRAKSTFLANMSHEFRTPLNAILGFTQIMARDKRLSSEHRSDIEIIHRSSEHLLGLINDVLEMSKIEAGRTTLNEQGFDLYHLLDGLYEMFALRAEKKGVALVLELAPGVPNFVRGDEGKLRQVLMNLLGNAVKFTQAGRVTLRVEAQAQPTGAAVSIAFAVSDTGPGMTPAELQHLFVPFVQTGSGRQSQEGTGLGLAISQQFVRLMGGEIQVRSAPGQGSTFAFALPMEVISAGDLEKPPATRRVIGLEPGQPVYRLLVVDDQEVNRRLLLKLFRPLGFEVREAANGQEALAVWEAWQPHLIWMDMRMPVMDGYEATRRIKATTRGMATIIIALTASALEEDRAVILSEGCDDYIRKPFREDELFTAVARYLGVRYVYEEIAPAATRAADTGSMPLPADDLNELAAQMQSTSLQWRAQLEHATVLGDQDTIQQLADQVAAQNPRLAKTLQHLASQYDHDRILTAIHDAQGLTNDDGH